MIERFDLIHTKGKQQEYIQLARWAYNSHWWIELRPGYCECKWCGKKHSSEWGVTKDYPMCKENYSIKRHLEMVGG